MKGPFQKIFLQAFALFCTFNASAQVFSLTPGGHFVINGNPTFVANNGGIKNNGTFTRGNGTVLFTGYSDTTVSFITGDSVTAITNLSVNKTNGSVATKSKVWVYNVLTMYNGKLYADSALTLISDVNNTARVAPVPVNTSRIEGKAIVQRYIPARRSWRLLTAPVTSSNTIYNSWQNNGVYQTGKGTLITMPTPIPANSGMDAGINANYSMKSFNPATQGLVSIANSKTANISPGNTGSADNAGYFIFVRGDRDPSTVANPNNGYVPVNTTTLSSSGILQQGDQMFTAAATAGKYTLIGNPYASPIDFDNVTLNNVTKRFYVWDPSLNQVGGYVVLDDAINSGVYIKSVSRSAQTKEIQSGQAFFVQTTSTAPASVLIQESSKSTTNNLLMFRPAAVTETITTNLYLLNSDNTTSFADATVAQFNESFSADVDWLDASKFANVNEGISMLRNGKSLSIERRPLITANDTIFFKLAATTARSYQLEVIGDNMQQPGLTPFLIDTYKGTSTPLDLYASSGSTVNFSITSDAASAVANRFMIVFRTAGVLPVTFTSVKAYQKSTGIQVDWNVESEVNVMQYEVEKSADGKTFTKTNITIPTGNNNSSVNYGWLDSKPFEGVNYYRIKSIDKDGTVRYSQIIRVVSGSDNTTAKTSDITVYPNPVVGNVMNVLFSNEPAGDYMIRLLNTDGQAVFASQVAVSSSNMTQAISLPASLPKGTYELKVNGSNTQSVQKIVIQ
ncbi:T9SS type A sorting domain-containing protein [Ferruginibacter albus]|uniref:T9SS type A sorting domain-containing protein n=1 Tax=Ferruginibacter albus TaxID=2875540 RepID=UPI001CC77B0D|nr:T9SS type A sorting domain-containing protein [Ferruginibacter albus]UAY50639.1 T9SS type A sorting domain-containing protein [Ferruginibacter albus]